jgi:hypothetical protein
MNSKSSDKPEEQSRPHIDLPQLAKDEAWSDIKKVRAQLTLYSMKKSMSRVLKEK